MAKQGVNLTKLKEEIESRKKEKAIPPSKFGENSNIGTTPRDTFLNGLLESLKTGRETASSSLVKTVDNEVSKRQGEAPKHNIQEKQVLQESRPINDPNIGMSPERDELLFREIESKRKQTLAESIENYTKTPHTGAPMTNNPQQYQGQTQINEGYLVENVKKIVDKYLIENFGVVVEEAIKDTILEMYAVERIKTVLQENKELIKSAVIEVIKEIQAKNKSKAQ